MCPKNREGAITNIVFEEHSLSKIYVAAQI